ncbi:MAG TPA: GntR family transcriptional regulator [Tepidisphaeraceae bacterium]|nr:GntR family transcriptional regulator [Tepidisphaeraceae bacterium]
MSLKDTVVQRINDAVKSGELKAGQQLTELGLAHKLGVGQPTIREALIELEFMGMVEQVGKRKTRITLLTRRAIDEIYVVRTTLETLAAELVARQKDPDLSVCRTRLEQMEDAAHRQAYQEFFQADLEFHRALWRATQNRSLEEVLERLVPKLFAFGIIQHARPSAEELIAMANLHRQLLELLPTGDVAATRRLMDLSMGKAWLDDAQLPERS